MSLHARTSSSSWLSFQLHPTRRRSWLSRLIGGRR